MAMTVAQVLKRVKALPTRQRDRIVREILALQNKGRQPVRGRRTRITWPDVEARAKRITGGRVIPNLVLLERGEASGNYRPKQRSNSACMAGNRR